MDGTRLAAAGRSLEAVAGQVLQTADVRFQNSAGRLRIDSTARRCRDFAATLADRANRLEQAFDRRLQDHDRTLAQTARLLDSHSFERVLDKGFVLVSDAAGKPVLSADRAAAGDQVSLQFRDGIRVAVMEGAGRRQAAASTATARPRRRRPVGDDQESLF
jgi:exodeoxyribonuclease VII large subunit